MALSPELRCYQNVYVNSFFACAARPLNSLNRECFSFSYDVNGFKSRIKSRHLLTVDFFWTDFLYAFCAISCLFVLLFLVTPRLVVATQPSQWPHLSWFPICSTFMSIMTFHRLWKTNPHGKDAIDSTGITGRRLDLKNWWNIDEFSSQFFQCRFDVEST